jgi:hypothetical protein
MRSRRNFLLSAAALGAAAAGAPEGRADGPAGDPDDESLRPLLAKSAYVFAGEVVSLGPEIIACGSGPSLLERSCTFRVSEALKGAGTAAGVHVSIVRYADVPGVELKPGAGRVLFLRPFRDAGDLGAETNPFVTTDKWFAVQPRSGVLVSTLKRLAGPRA